MGEYSPVKADTVASTIEDYSVDAMNTDGPSENTETEWQNPEFTKYFGYYKQIPELKRAIDMKAMWTVGKGYITPDTRTKVVLDRIHGWGNDTFNTILENMIIMMLVNGDSFAEVMKDNQGELVNLKPLDPSSIKIIVNRKGIIQKYQQTTKLPNKGTSKKDYTPNQILHFTNDRVADEIHGVSIITAAQWVIDALNEAQEDQRKVMHRNVAPVKIWKVDADNDTALSKIKKVIQDANRDFENIVIPKDTIETEILSVPSNATLNILPWINYLKSLFFVIVGVAEVQTGAPATGTTESGSKIAFLSSEQAVIAEQRYVESMVRAQLGLNILLSKTASLEAPLQADEAKDGAQGQTNFQPNETTAGVGR